MVSKLVREVFGNLDKIEPIQSQRFFTAITKDVFEEEGVDESVIVYVSNLLNKFISANRVYKVSEDDKERQNYISDMLKAADKGDSHRIYLTDVHIGDYSLFLTGIFPECPENNRFLDKGFYFYFGKRAYKAASHSSRSKKLGLEKVFDELSSDFEDYAFLLNSVKERYMPPNKGVLSDIMFDEFSRYKETKDKRHLESARSIAGRLGIDKKQFPSLYRNL